MTEDLIFLYECTACHWIYSSPLPLRAMSHGTCPKAKHPPMVPVPEPVP